MCLQGLISKHCLVASQGRYRYKQMVTCVYFQLLKRYVILYAK